MYGMPIMQVLLFGFALTSEVKNADIVVIDNAHDNSTRQLTTKLKASTYFNITEAQYAARDIEQQFRKSKMKAVVVFPANFEHDLISGKKAQMQILADGSEPNTAKTIIQYINAIVQSYQQQMGATAKIPLTIVPETRMLYNEEGNGSMNFIPGVMALILMIICTALTSVAVVREKELGTMEILLVSPFKPLMVLVAKAIPYLVLSLINFTFILLLAIYVMHVPVAGSIVLLYAESLLFIFASLAFGLFISNNTSTQQAALLISFMGMLLPTIIFTGFIFPLENMPIPFQIISNFVPAKWYYSIVKSVMLKGLGFEFVWKETLVLIAMSVILLGITIKKFKIRLA